MSEFDDLLPAPMPRPDRRQQNDEVVMPPDESMLSADDLLAGIPQPSTQSASLSMDSEDDLLLSLPPEALADADLRVQVDAAPAAAADASRETQSEQDGYRVGESLEMSLDESAQVSEPVSQHDANDPLRVGVLDDEQLAASEQGVVDLEPQISNAAGEEKPQGFIEKHKPKMIIAGVVALLLGIKYWQDNKAAEEALASAPKEDPASMIVQQSAIEDLQKGEASIDPLTGLGQVAPMDDADVASLFGESAGNDAELLGAIQSPAAVPPVVAPGAAAPVAPVAAVAPVAPVEPPPLAAAPAVEPVPAVAPVEPAASTPAPAAVLPSTQAPVQQAADDQTSEVDRLKAELQRAELRIKEAEAEIARLKREKTPPVSKAPARQAPEPRRESRVVTSAKPPQQSKPAQAQAASKRSDIQYIGSFLRGSQWGAHVVIAGNLYELTAGQRIANLTVDSVTGSGVSINGVQYR